MTVCDDRGGEEERRRRRGEEGGGRRREGGKEVGKERRRRKERKEGRRRWSPEKESALRDCFNTTVWDVLMNPHGEDIEGMTHCLTDYLNFCADVVSPVKTVRCYPNNKPWVTREVKTVLNKKKGCLQEQRQGGHESSTAGGETLCEGSQGQLQEKGGAEAEGTTT
ncbi:hypothetical protein L3Q82_012833 [Scortum barcoo]|uniref:Uncharacterized protein n=1 Tax=Scortum barcoo TaxID=214431 RepID=A0ACB8W3S0_9TELE|nr:hypothetical protein L3Q82_012833 [Scortum barcoo]